MTTKIVAAVLLIVALASAGTVGVAYYSDYSFTTEPAPPSMTGDSCFFDPPPSCASEKSCCDMPSRGELIEDAGAGAGDK